MKKTDILLIASVLLYSFLFYNHFLGINLLIFNLFIISGFALQNRKVLRSPGWLTIAAGAIVSAFNTAWHPSGLAVGTNYLSVLALIGFNGVPRASVVAAGLHGMYSLVGFSVFRRLKEWQISSKMISEFTLRNVLLSVVPLAVTLVFFVLYMNGNPIFSSLVESVDLSMLPMERIFFTAGGVILMVAFFYPVYQAHLGRLDANAADNLQRTRKKAPRFPFGFSFKILSLKNEYQVGRLLLLMLNGLLFAMNMMDVYYLFIVGELPQGINYSEFLHQSFNALMFSMVLAIGVILYFFRGNLNFYSGNFFLKGLAYCWIGQNAILLVITGVKNGWYISEYDLTYLRIFVFFALLVVLTGLATTFIKLYQVKSIWFMLRKNAWAFYLLIVFAGFFNWAKIVAAYNLSHADQQVDIDYLISLRDYSLLPELMELNRRKSLNAAQQQELLKGYENFSRRMSALEWQSWNYEYVQIQKELNAKN